MLFFARASALAPRAILSFPKALASVPIAADSIPCATEPAPSAIDNIPVAFAFSPMAIASNPVAVPPPSSYEAAIALPANKTREETRTPLFIALFDFLPFDLVISETATHAPNDSFQITRYTLFITTSPQSQFLSKKLSLLSKKLFYFDIIVKLCKMYHSLYPTLNTFKRG